MDRGRFFKHRNSQKHIYQKGLVYFVTGITQNRYPYFKEKIFFEVFREKVFRENLYLCQQLKGFELFGWFLGWDHFHLSLMPGSEFNISKIIQSLKRNISHNINYVIGDIEGANNYSRLQYRNMLNKFRSQFHQKYPNPKTIPFPIFRWLKSFHDHLIRNEKDFENHLKYTAYNVEKHEMPANWKFMEILL